jgi:drug/metabolite transporter (DMT)-like permease
MGFDNQQSNYRLGSLYAIATAILLATQEPFSVLAAKRLSSPYFLGITQFALLLSVPLLTSPANRRRDFMALLTNRKHLGRLLILFCVGLAGLLLYNFGLSSAHPIIVAVILNLSPFWAALVALVVSRKGVPVSRSIYLFCFLLAFVGAMTVAWSQMDNSSGHLLDEIIGNFWRRTWMYAIPVPIFYALSGTLVGHWFSDFDEGATIAASFVVSSTILIPATIIISWLRPVVIVDGPTMYAILLLMLGTLAAAAAGRVFYQVALKNTGNDNGFVTMFFLLIPGITALISIPLSWWIADLRFIVDPLFFLGLALITASLFLFSYKALRKSRLTATVEFSQI